jgi:hypothetical protein
MTMVGVLEATIEAWIVMLVMGISGPGTQRLMHEHNSNRCRDLAGCKAINRRDSVQLQLLGAPTRTLNRRLHTLATFHRVCSPSFSNFWRQCLRKRKLKRIKAMA